VTFGVTGSLQTGTYPDVGNELAGATVANDLDTFAGTTGSGTYEWFTPAGVLKTGTIEDNATITPSTTDQTVNTGLYRSVTASAVNNSIDANIAAENIKKDVVILGVTGNVTFPATTDVRLNTTYGPNLGSTGSLVAESHNNCDADGATDCIAIAAFPAADVSDRIVNGKAVNVEQYIVKMDGKTLAGKAGSATAGMVLASGAHRDQTASQITYAQEAATGLGTGYRAVPNILKDDDGYTASANAVLKLTRPTAGTWQLGPTAAGTRKVCGKSPTPNTIAGRISDCLSKNPGAATWNGAANGISGEGSWKLVSVYSTSVPDDGTTACDATCYEVWRDERTGLLWSDRLGESGAAPTTTANWCRAAGNMQTAATTLVDIDSGVAGNQDCGDQDNTNPTKTNFAYNESWCAEVGLTTPTGITAGVTNITTFEFDSAKGGMRWTTTPAAKWRLPTKFDFEVADHNGIRHVLPNMATGFWSASVFSYNRSYAWRFFGNYGPVYDLTRVNPIGVRCVGGE
jgi:hypothetical protein